MRISELARESGTSVATIKYYLREGLLAPGERVNAREASYGQGHVRRLRLIRAMVEVLGASIEQVRKILRAADDADRDPPPCDVGGDGGFAFGERPRSERFEGA